MSTSFLAAVARRHAHFYAVCYVEKEILAQDNGIVPWCLPYVVAQSADEGDQAMILLYLDRGGDIDATINGEFGANRVTMLMLAAYSE